MATRTTLTKKQISFMYDYFKNNPAMCNLLEKKNMVTYRQLYLLIPNNIKKMHGLPMSSKYPNRKKVKKYNIYRELKADLFDYIEKFIEEELNKESFYEKFSTIYDFSASSQMSKYGVVPACYIG